MGVKYSTPPESHSVEQLLEANLPVLDNFSARFRQNLSNHSHRCDNPSRPKKQGRSSGEYFEDLAEKSGRKVSATGNYQD